MTIVTPQIVPIIFVAAGVLGVVVMLSLWHRDAPAFARGPSAQQSLNIPHVRSRQLLPGKLGQ